MVTAVTGHLGLSPWEGLGLDLQGEAPGALPRGRLHRQPEKAGQGGEGGHVPRSPPPPDRRASGSVKVEDFPRALMDGETEHRELFCWDRGAANALVFLTKPAFRARRSGCGQH